MKNFKKKFQDLISIKRIPQKEVAESIGMSEASFARMISSSTIKVSTLEKISSCLDISPSYFLDENAKYKSEESNTFSKETVVFLQEQLREKDHTIRKLLEHLGPVAAGKLKVYPPEERLQPMSGQLKVA